MYQKLSKFNPIPYKLQNNNKIRHTYIFNHFLLNYCKKDNNPEISVHLYRFCSMRLKSNKSTRPQGNGHISPRMGLCSCSALPP